MMIKAPLGLSLLRNRSILISEENKKTNPSPVEKRFGSSWFDTKNKRHPNACSPVDIPTGWEPRTKQQPTGLIAYPAAQGRAVQVLLSAQKKKRHTNVCSPVDIPTGWEPRTKQQPTGLIAYPAAQGRAVQVLLSAQKKKRHTNVCLFLVQ